MLVSACTPQRQGAEPVALPMNVGGRVLMTEADGVRAYEYSWPGIYFETVFTGDQLTLRFDDDQNIFWLWVDDREPMAIHKPGQQVFNVPGLTEGTHHVRLEKLTETQSSTGRFLGFYALVGATPQPLPGRTRQIEFIGDSHTVGYGNTSVSRECTDEKVFATTNTSLAFGPLTAKAFDADYVINAFSGQGVVRNYNGSSPESSLLKRYPFAVHGKKQRYLDPHWQPQVIVIGLGTNDFSTPLNADEKWRTRKQLQQDYIAHYVAFVEQLHQEQPQAQFILLSSDHMQGEFAEQVAKVVSALAEQGVDQVTQLVFKASDGITMEGCHWHPSTADNQVLAKRLIQQIHTQLHW